MLIAAVAFTLPACSDEDEPSDNLSNEQAEWIRNAVLDTDGEIIFSASTQAGIYLLPAEDAAIARGLCEGIIAEEWDGKSLRLSLGDDGSVNLTPSVKEGVYYEMTFNLKNVTAFSLEVASPEYCESENSRPTGGKSGYWLCTGSGCGHVFYSKPAKCPFCGGSSFVFRQNRSSN